LIFRPLEPGELDLVPPLLVRDPVSALTPERFRARIGTGEYRPERIWIAEESPGAAPVAAAIWWGTAQEPQLAALDWLYATTTDRIPIATGLLTAAHQAYAADGLERPPDYHLFLPADWRERPDVATALTWRLEAARRAGLTHPLERLRYEWTPASGAPPQRSGRLGFRPEADDEVFVDVFSQVLAGTLDATTRKEAEASGTRTQARKDVAFYRDRMEGQRSWWRIAETPSGEIAGFGIPSKNTEFPVVGYLGVVPGHRGHGYVDEILAEVTRILVAEAGATAIHADTDLENLPMAAAFERAGYRITGRRLVLSARRPLRPPAQASPATETSRPSGVPRTPTPGCRRHR